MAARASGKRPVARPAAARTRSTRATEPPQLTARRPSTPRAAAAESAEAKPVIKPKPASGTGKKAASIRRKVVAGRVPRKFNLEIPPILLEGDTSPPPPVSGPGQRYALGPTPPAEHFDKSEHLGELPEAYGTKQLFLAARDPHSLYAHWDLTSAQQSEYNRRSSDGHLILRIYRDAPGGEPVAQVRVQPESRHWFVQVGRGGTAYFAQLGYHGRDGRWTLISTSEATMTPPERASTDTSVKFATLPQEVPLPTLVELSATLSSPEVPQQTETAVASTATSPSAKRVGAEIARQDEPAAAPVSQSADSVNALATPVASRIPLVAAIQQLHAAGRLELPPAPDFVTREWTREQESTLAQIVSTDRTCQVRAGSLEIAEMVRHELVAETTALEVAGIVRHKVVEEMASLAAAQISPAVSAQGGISSPVGGQPQPKGFWFNINAELVIYGATEPDATVTIAGRQIKLRPDGTFSYRFALPDGDFTLPAAAISLAGSELRWANLQFVRNTQYSGDVGAHPQDPALKPPKPENL